MVRWVWEQECWTLKTHDGKHVRKRLLLSRHLRRRCLRILRFHGLDCSILGLVGRVCSHSESWMCLAHSGVPKAGVILQENAGAITYTPSFCLNNLEETVNIPGKIKLKIRSWVRFFRVTSQGITSLTLKQQTVEHVGKLEAGTCWASNDILSSLSRPGYLDPKHEETWYHFMWFVMEGKRLGVEAPKRQSATSSSVGAVPERKEGKEVKFIHVLISGVHNWQGLQAVTAPRSERSAAAGCDGFWRGCGVKQGQKVPVSACLNMRPLNAWFDDRMFTYKKISITMKLQWFSLS